METLNIKGMFQNPKWSPKLQKIALYKLIQMIKYKAEWYGKEFIQIDRFYPSSQMQQLRIPIHRPNTRNPQMDLPKMQNNTPQKHKRRKKHPKRRKKNNQKLLKLK